MKIKTKKAVLIILALALTLSLGLGVSNFSKPVGKVKAATTTISIFDGTKDTVAPKNGTTVTDTTTKVSYTPVGMGSLTEKSDAKKAGYTKTWQSGGATSSSNSSSKYYIQITIPEGFSVVFNLLSISNGSDVRSSFVSRTITKTLDESICYCSANGTPPASASKSEPQGAGTYYVCFAASSCICVLTLDVTSVSQGFTVTYNTNGGSEVSNATVAEGESITLAEAPTKSGYDFVEWNTVSDGSGDSFAPGDSFTPQANTVFYAIWSAKAYAISFDLDGETAENLPDKATCGSNVTLPTLSRDGYNLSWSVKTASGKAITVSDNSFVMPDSDVTVTAIFEERDLVTVIFMDGDAEYTRVKTRVGAYVERPQDPPLKSNSLRFGGWYTDNTKSSHGNKFDFDEDTITGETTLYSLWIDPVDTVSFKNYIDSLINKTASNIKGQPAWATEGFKTQFNYIDGVFLNGVVNLYYATYDTKYKDFFLDFVTNYVNSDGDLVNVTTGNKITLLKELDFVCESKILFDAYELSLDEKYIKAIEKNYANLLSMGIVKNTNDNYEHKSKYSQQIWLDGMYMYAPFNARYLSATGKDVSEFHKLRMQYQFIADNMKDELTGLYYHAYSQNTSLQWVDPTNYCSHNFWLRSVGWLTMSLVDVIEYFPGGEDRDALVNMFQGLVDSLLQFKDADTNMYYQIVNYDSYIDANNRNYLEVSGSSMIAYSLLKGGRLGYLKSDVIDYRAEGEKAFEGIYSHSLDASTNKLYDICKQAGLDGSGKRDGTIEYYLSEPVSSNEGKGVGPFILAFIEYTNKKPDAPITPDIRQKTVTFNVDGETTSSYQTYTRTTVIKPENPTVSQKTFSHWSTTPCGAEFDFSQTVESDLTLYAVWEEESLVFDYSAGDSFKAEIDITASEKLPDYAFVGWIKQDDASTIYNANDTVTASGKYTVLFAKSSFIGGSLRKTGKTGVRLGFDIEILNITDSQLLADIAKDISAKFTIRTSKDNVFSAKSYKIENGRIVLYAVITNDIDATVSDADVNKCNTLLSASISVTFATSNVTITASYSNFSIKDIATLALRYNYIDTTFAKKYGYGA